MKNQLPIQVIVLTFHPNADALKFILTNTGHQPFRFWWCLK